MTAISPLSFVIALVPNGDCVRKEEEDADL